RHRPGRGARRAGAGDGGLHGTATRRIDACYVTLIVPFIPAAACPETVHLKDTVPFLSVTVSVVDLPGASSFDFFPAMLKSCLTEPLLVTLKVTEPAFRLFFESVKRNSLGLPAVTLSDVAASAGIAHARTAHVRPARIVAVIRRLLTILPNPP